MKIKARDIKNHLLVKTDCAELFCIDQDAALGSKKLIVGEVKKEAFNPAADLVAAVAVDGVVVPVEIAINDLKLIAANDADFLGSFPITQSHYDKEWSVRGGCEEYLDMDFISIVSGAITEHDMVSLDACLTINLLKKHWFCSIGINEGEGSDNHVDLVFTDKGKIDFSKTKFNEIVTSSLVRKHFEKNAAFNRGILTIMMMTKATNKC